jgi:hypothetical protein
MTKMAKARRQSLDLFLFFFIFCFPCYPAPNLVQLAPQRNLPLTGFAANLGKSGAFHIILPAGGRSVNGVFTYRGTSITLSAVTAKELAATFLPVTVSVTGQSPAWWSISCPKFQSGKSPVGQSRLAGADVIGRDHRHLQLLDSRAAAVTERAFEQLLGHGAAVA